jgi:hypothetical protein
LQGTSRRIPDEEDVALSAFDSFCRAAEQGRFPRLGGRDDLWALLVLTTVRKAADLANRNRREPVVGPLPAESGEGGLSQIEGDDPAPGIAAELAEEFRLWPDRRVGAGRGGARGDPDRRGGGGGRPGAAGAGAAA